MWRGTLFLNPHIPWYRKSNPVSGVRTLSSVVRKDLDVFVYPKEVLDRLLADETDYEALRPDVLS